MRDAPPFVKGTMTASTGETCSASVTSGQINSNDCTRGARWPLSAGVLIRDRRRAISQSRYLLSRRVPPRDVDGYSSRVIAPICTARGGARCALLRTLIIDPGPLCETSLSLSWGSLSDESRRLQPCNNAPKKSGPSFLSFLSFVFFLFLFFLFPLLPPSPRNKRHRYIRLSSIKSRSEMPAERN